jgi:amino acid adenylation domain-containing protein
MATDPIRPGDTPGNIGRAVCGTSWIVDQTDHTKLAPIGTVGELLIKGPNMARHYVNSPQATDQAFVHLPEFFGSSSLQRFYRTGDLVQYLSDGSIEYLGRRDTQVKLAGQRVDLTYIEHYLQKCVPSSVEVCVVVAAHQRILAGFLADNRSAPDYDPSHIRAQLLESLPSYMVPGVIHTISRMPTTATGKLDRRRLSKMASESITDTTSISPSRQCSEAEEVLRNLWASALGISSTMIHPESTLLEYGDSISAMKLSSLARKSGIILNVATIFMHPTLADMAMHTQSCPAYNDTTAPFSLIEAEQLAMVVAATASQCRLDKHIIEDVYPCTPLQEGLMALSMKEEGAYVAQHVLRLKPSVDIRRFKGAWGAVIQSSPVLRTRFLQFNNEIIQAVINTEVEWIAGQDLETYLSAGSDKRPAFGESLINLGLVNDEESCWCIFTAHHSIIDGWSLYLILEQVEKAYRSQLAPPSLHFRTFVGSLLKSDQDASAAYWQGQLQDSPDITFPPAATSNRIPLADSVRTHEFTLPAVPKSDITTSTFVRAAWAILISQHCLSDDVVVGTTLSGRSMPLPGIIDLIGPTITTVPVRVRLIGSQMVESFLRQLQDQATDMIPHEHFGLRNIRRLNSDAEAACNFQSLLILQPPMALSEGDVFADRQVEIVEQIRTFVLTLQVRMEGQQVRLVANFDESMLNGRYVSWLLSQIEHILKQLYQNPFALLQDIKAFCENDEKQIEQWVSEAPEFVDRCIHDIFADRVREMPDSCAVLAWDGQVSYKELDDMSTQLAWQINGLGLQPENTIPILFEKTLWTQVALFGAIKAGATFVLLDPDHPTARLQGIIDDVEAKLILSSTKYKSMSQSFGIPVLVVDKASIGQLAYTNSLPPVTISPQHALYIHFSSGTTGKPKGSIIEHCSYATSAAATCRAMELYPGPESANRVIHFAAHSYDQCIGEMLGTLMHGGVLCIPSDFERNNDIIGAINKYNCSRATFTPSFGRLIAPSDVPCLRVVVVGGESIAEQDIDHWRGVKLFNAYGPSETTVSSCVKEWPRTNSTTDFRSIGHPIDAAHYFIVEPGNHHQRTPLGGLGEIVIDGPTVARQYLKEPEKSKEVFVDRPAWLSGQGTPVGRKLYKTGDFARYSPDGEFIFLGRRDTQVKLRSQRLELSEVEHHISAQLGSSDEVVVEMITIASLPNAILAAFIRLGSEQRLGNIIDEVTASEQSWVTLQDQLVTHLGQVVPGYMIPTAYFPLRRVPLTNSHKVDRKQIRASCAEFTAEQLASFSCSQKQKKLPTNHLELTMCATWSDVLGISKDMIGIEDNFFRLGGDSIDAMKMVAKCRSQGLSLTMATVFQYPRLADMCLTLTGALSDSARDDEVEPFSLLLEHEIETLRGEASVQCGLRLDVIDDIYPATPLQEGLFAVSAKRPGMEVAQMSFSLDEPASIHRLKGAWEFVIRQTPILRTRMIATKSGTFQVVTNELIDWISAGNLLEYAAKDRETPMLNGDRLFRLAVVEEADSGRAYICVTIHHALYDGWSWGLLVESVENAYAGIAAAPLVPFNHFVRFLMTSNLTSKSVAKEYWSKTLASTSADIFPKMPSSFYTPRANRCVEKIMLGASPSNVTLANAVCAAWALVISRYSENNDVVFGTVVTGRTVPVEGIESVLGPTFTTVPVRIEVDPTVTIDDYLQQVQARNGSMDSFASIGLQSIRNINPDTKEACSFQNLLVVQPEQRDGARGGVLNKRQDLDEMATFNNYALMLECTPEHGGLRFNASFDSNLISEFQMHRILSQLAHVFQQFLSKGEKQLRDVDMLSPEDYQQISEWNCKTPEVIERCIHTAIQSQAEYRPDAEAICAWDGNLSFAELMALSSPLASHLHELGARPNDIIPIVFEKSKWAVVSMMAVMMSGAAFVLLDPAYHSEDRLVSLAVDVKAKIVIASQTYVSYFHTQFDWVITISQDFLETLPTNFSLPEHLYHPDNIFCVMFTSGSTGKPKAIVHGHSGMYSSFEAFGPALVLNSESRVFQFAAYAFDASVGDNLATLMHGGCICIPSEEERINDFNGAFNRLNANWVHLTPSLGRSLSPDKLPGIKNILLGGEALMQTELKLWSERAHLMSSYGPAESSLCISGTLKEGVRSPPNLGLTVGCRTWVVDTADYTRLAPIGVVGHLVIEGPVNAYCYLNDLEKTAMGFISPQHVWIPELASSQNQRMYRTGDLVRYTADGTVEFVERRDTQIKLRGQRIELAEVEFHLREALMAVGYDTECAVAKIAPSGATSLLAAFIEAPKLANLPQSDRAETIGKLLSSVLAHMSPKLVSYKLPAVLIPISNMPRTPSQKIDRKELLKSASIMTEQEIASYARSGQVGRPPSTKLEKRLCSLFARILALREDQVYADDMFPRLGGDSIQGMRLVALAREEGISITVSQLFSLSSITELANHLPSLVKSVGHHNTPHQSGLFQLAAEKCNVDVNCVQDVYTCTPLQEGLMSLSLEKRNAYVAHNAFQLPHDLDLARFRRAWDDVFARNAILRTRMIPLQDKSLLVVLEDKFSWLTGTSLQDAIEEEKSIPMGLGLQLNRFRLVVSDAGPFLLWTAHHSTYDGWSMKLLIEQVEAAYNGTPINGSPSFKSFVANLDMLHLESSVFWTRRIASSPVQSFPEKPPPGVRPNVNLFAQRQVPLNKRPGSNIAISSLLRAAWALTLRQHCNGATCSFGTISSGRSSDFPGIDEIVGPTLCTIPVVIDVNTSLSVFSFLEEQQKLWLETLQHEHFGLQNIARLNGACKAACNFQNLLVIQPKQLQEAETTAVMGTWLKGTEYSDFFSYPLTVQCTLGDSTCEIFAGCDGSLIGKDVMENILSQFDSILQQLSTESATQTISQLDTLGADGLRQITEWNHESAKTQAPHSRNSYIPVHARISNQALARPLAEAVCAWDATFSFEEVDRYSDALAAHLIFLGVGPDVLVPFCFEKSAWIVVAMLAILKAGGAFVPLEASYPLSWLTNIVEQTEAKVVLTSPELFGMCSRLPALAVQVSKELLDSLPSAPMQRDARLGDTAYVIFTSGSTGTPKGVVMEHGAFSRGVTDHGYALGFGSTTRALNFASSVFDAR